MPGLGWLKVDDPRDYPMSAALPVGIVMPEYRYWVPGVILDQGQVNACVGFAIRQWMQTSPIRYKQPTPTGLEIYRRALEIDEFPGNADTGTSLRAGVKVAQEQGRIDRYVWTNSTEEIKQWILTQGSVIVGTKLTQGMLDAVDWYMNPTGNTLGGHAYLLTGYSKSRDAFRVANSWGVRWAHWGRAWIRASVLQLLLNNNQGDAVGIVEK